MAQVCGGTTFDIVARRKHDAAQRVLSRAADTLAMHGRDSLNLDSVLAVLLRIFLSRWSDLEYFSLRHEARTLESWLSIVGTALQEAESLIPVSAASVTTEVLTLLRAELSFAAEQWLLGDPEKPPTAHALNAIEHVLFTHRLIHRPGASQLPTTLYNVQNNAPNA